MKYQHLLTSVVAVALLALSAPAVQAAPGYCSQGTQSTGLDTGDMTLNGNNADDCYGHAFPSNENPDTLTNLLNGLNWGSDWQFVVRDEGAASAGSFGGYNWTLSAPQNATSGSWTLTLAPITGLPITVDFVAFIKGGTGGDYFLFNDETLFASNAGTFTMTFVQGRGDNAGAAGLSGFSLFARDLQRVPEPGTLALLGIGLAGIALVRHRRV